MNTDFKLIIDMTLISNTSDSETLIYYIPLESFPSISPTSDIPTLYAKPPTLLTIKLRPPKWATLPRRNLSS